LRPRRSSGPLREPGWTLGTYTIQDDGWEDATHLLVVRGAAEAMGDSPDPNFIIVPGLVPLVSKETGEIEYVVAQRMGPAGRDAAGAWLVRFDR
jgi:hypothetical protein